MELATMSMELTQARKDKATLQRRLLEYSERLTAMEVRSALATSGDELPTCSTSKSSGKSGKSNHSEGASEWYVVKQKEPPRVGGLD
jgi:hypothetical protein